MAIPNVDHSKLYHKIPKIIAILSLIYSLFFAKTSTFWLLHLVVKFTLFQGKFSFILDGQNQPSSK